MKLLTIILLFPLYFSYGYAQITLKEHLLISCVTDNYYYYTCSLKEGVLYPDSPWEKVYKITYRQSCKGHSLNIGFRLGDIKKSITYGPNDQTIKITGKGSLELVDFNKKLTSHASLIIKDCLITINSILTDLSPNSKNSLNATLDQRDRLAAILGNFTNIESSANTILSLVTQLNPSQILSLMQSLRKDVVEMQDITPKGRDKRTLQGIIDLIDNKIAENPGFNDEKLKEKITNALNDLIKISPTATDLLQEEIETLNIKAEEILSYASLETQRTYENRMP